MNPDGTDQTRLYHSDCCVGFYSAPIWSPDGKRIAFSADSAGGTFVINADGSGLKQLSSDATAALSWQRFAAASARPTPGHYAGPTSEQTDCSVNFGNAGCEVTFKVANHGKRVTGFTTADGYNGMCNYTGTVPHIFQYLVKWSRMKIRSNGSFTGTAKAKLASFTGTFKVKGRFRSGKASGTVTRLGTAGTCGSFYASNPETSSYAETFTETHA